MSDSLLFNMILEDPISVRTCFLHQGYQTKCPPVRILQSLGCMANQYGIVLRDGKRKLPIWEWLWLLLDLLWQAQIFTISTLYSFRPMYSRKESFFMSGIVNFSGQSASFFKNKFTSWAFYSILKIVLVIIFGNISVWIQLFSRLPYWKNIVVFVSYYDTWTPYIHTVNPAFLPSNFVWLIQLSIKSCRHHISK
jgi:hypothetical protein